MMTNSPSHPPEHKNWTHAVILSLLLVLVLAAAAYFRFSGLDWGEYQFLHPDERFLIWVGTDISPVDSLSAYFNTTESSLNPHNRGHGFYVYGTLPMFLARYLVEWIFGQSGFQEMTDMGRALSALADLGTVFLVYLVGKRLYDRRVGVLAAAFSAATVLQIQQAHFFTMDTFLTFFSFLAFYFATLVIKIKPKSDAEDEKTQPKKPWLEFIRDPLVLSSLGFGTALGLAVASKLNAAAVAIVLPIAMGLVLLRLWTENNEDGDGVTSNRLMQVLNAFLLLVLAALVSIIVFRLAQPYAFSGPEIWGVKPNPQWVQNIREQRSQSGGDVDFPPAMQWARRPIWFSLQNMVLWGLGLPLGILAWAGFLWAGWRLLSGWHRRSVGGYGTSEWDSHLLIWSWTAFYFAWQSIQLNPTMRYQLLIYPTLAIFAAWAVFALYDRSRIQGISSRKPAWNKIAATLIGATVLVATAAYAYAFTQIYNRPITRIEASRWIYQNVPGPITLPIETEKGVQNQILPFPYDYRILPQLPYITSFKPNTQGELREILLPDVLDESVIREERNLRVTIQTIPASETPLASGAYSGYLSRSESNEETAGEGTNREGVSLIIPLDQSIPLNPEQTYELKISLPFGEPISTFNESADIIIEPFSGVGDAHVQTVHMGINELQPGVPLAFTFQAEADGMLYQVLLEQQAGGEGASAPQPIGINLQSGDPNEQPLYSPTTLQSDPNSSIYQVQLSEPLPLEKGGVYRASLAMEPRGGVVALRGTAIANEGDWDDGLPVRLDGYDGYGGIYPTDLNFNMYWDDNSEKVERFIRILDEADLLTISSNRQWGTLPRIPERFPMTSVYYRELLGCPPEQSVEYCYRVAEPGMYRGNLGYELAQVFVSEPKIGSLRLNDQFAEEAFSVYDHPKVLIFEKTADYDPTKVRAILAGVDLSKIIRKPPLRYANHPEDLLLPELRWEAQQEGGTWSELFNTQSVINRFQPLSVLVWYLSLFLLGLVFYPLLRLALPGLKDHGYPLGRISGMLVISYLSWLAGSLEIPYTRLTISVVIAGLVLIGGVLAFQQRKELIQEWRTNRRYFLFVEALGLILFLAFLAVRIGNPDLWHPWKGGEKPMDFSYFNAVLKSTTFPPYDPWYAGGYLNYYYYGFVLVGTWVKWLGITPAIAYNLILPTLFSLIALGAFSLGWNITQRAHACRDVAQGMFSIPAPSDGESRGIPEKQIHPNGLSPYIPALAAALGMAVMGNLGIVKMIYQGYQRLIVPNELIEQSNVILRLGWAMQGFAKTLKGVKLQYAIGDWYWNPSRIIPAAGDVEPITEFPYFTLLYADLHAHLIALPITLLALTFMAGIVLGNAHWKSLLGGGLWFALAGLSIGALRPTNTWDLYPYLALGVISIIYAVWQQPPPDSTESWPDWLSNIPHRIRQPILAMVGALGLFGLVTLFFQPYTQWYALGYTKIDLWNGSHTPLSAYLNHWGLFLIVILPWMVWETRDWMAKTPVSALRKLKKVRYWILALFLMLWVAVALLIFWREVSIAWFVLPLAAWAGILILRPEQPDAKRMVLFLVGSGLILTLMVEVIVLVGDIGRMNTVFKFYLQVWTMFSISAAAALGWLWPALEDWQRGWRWAWQTVFIMLVAGASLYPMMATLAKIDDRIVAGAPHTLDGMAFMPYATYTDEWGQMDLGQDYQAIRWMQENVSGSPVIVEANLRNLYRWGSRYSIYTGLPGVVGWEWHQQQQRAVTPGVWVTERILEIDDFYLTEDWNQASSFLQKYNVRYIIVGQQERGHYPGPGLEKFEQANGILWNEVFRNETTVIYQVITDNPSDQTGEEIETP